MAVALLRQLPMASPLDVAGLGGFVGPLAYLHPHEVRVYIVMDTGY